MSKHGFYQAYCEQRQANHQFRSLRETSIIPEGQVLYDGKGLINFASNDYLGLSQHPKLIERIKSYAAMCGAGSTASRLLTGNNPLYSKIENTLARGKGTEAAFVMSSGYQANLTVLAALADPDVAGKPFTVLADRLSHNSLLQGALLGKAQLTRFQHNDYDHLESHLKQQRAKDTHIIIVTESVFGMDGDRADLTTLIQLAETYDAMLYVDEAHATGILGPDGFGLTAEHKGKIDVVMGTFGKALGSFGAYIACSKTLRSYLIQRCGGLIYSTALPPAVLGSVEAALELIPNMNKERAYVAALANRLRDALESQGWDCGRSTTHIIPVLLGSEEAATELADILKQNGILAPAIRPPTVPRGSSRLRFSLSAAHKMEQVDQLITVMGEQVAGFAAPKQSLAS